MLSRRFGLLVLVTLILFSLVGGFVFANGQQEAEPSEEARSLDDHFAGKTIRIVVGASPGGGYDTYARIIAQHMSQYIPGEPKIIVQNMPGAGTTIAANYVYNQARPDGYTIGWVDGGNAIQQLIGGEGVEFEMNTFEYVGGYSENEVLAVTPDIEWDNPLDLFKREPPVTVGHFGGGSFHTTWVSVMMSALDSNMEMVGGYGGASEVLPAIERGEVDATGLTYGTVRSRHESGDLKIAVMSGPRVPALKEVATGTELADTERGQTLMKVLENVLLIRRVAMLPPGTPEDIVEALQDAYQKAVTDPELVETLEKGGRPTDWVSGKDTKRMAQEILNQPVSIIKDFRTVMTSVE